MKTVSIVYSVLVVAIDVTSLRREESDVTSLRREESDVTSIAMRAVTGTALIGLGVRLAAVTR
jgi:hypothetical protein